MDVKIDLIITKLVSRFARNIIDNLTTVRKLKNGVEVYSGKANIHTMDSTFYLINEEEHQVIIMRVLYGRQKISRFILKNDLIKQKLS